MIEDIYMSYWDDKRVTRDGPDINVLFWTLANRLANKHYKRVHLVTDSIGAERFGKLEWASVNTSLDVLPDHLRIFWSLSKIHACQEAVKAGKPFLHIDGDVFLWKPLPERLIQSPIITQSDEPWIWYNYPLKEFVSTLPYKPAAMLNTNHVGGYNCGIMGGNDLGFWKFYTDTVLDFTYDPRNKDWFQIGNDQVIDLKAKAAKADTKEEKHELMSLVSPQYQMAATICEQYMISACTAHLNKKMSILFEDRIRPMYQYKNAHFPELGYTHLCGMKHEKHIQDSVRRRVEENDLVLA